MLPVTRTLALGLFAAVALVATGCGSNNKGKIEGQWKIVSFPEKTATKTKTDMDEMTKAGMYIYMEFKTDGGLTFGLGADKPEMLAFVKAASPNQKITWDAKYKLLSGNGVEISDMPKDMAGGGGLFGSKDRAKVMVAVTGDNMTMTDADGATTLTRIK